jgi:hypothetical protein
MVLLLLHLVPPRGLFIIIIYFIIIIWVGRRDLIHSTLGFKSIPLSLSLSLSPIFIMKIHQCPLGLLDE